MVKSLLLLLVSAFSKTPTHVTQWLDPCVDIIRSTLGHELFSLILTLTCVPTQGISRPKSRASSEASRNAIRNYGRRHVTASGNNGRVDG